MTENELKYFSINYIDKKVRENENFVRYTFYDLRIKNNLSEGEIDVVLRISRDYLENNGYKVYFTNATYTYNNEKRVVEQNELMIAIKE